MKITRKKRLTPMRLLKKKCWAAFSIYIRKGAADINGYVKCATCNKTDHWSYYQAGHAVGGRHNAVLFDLFLVRPQCLPCNLYGGGEYGKFASVLIKEFGQEWYDEKQRLCGKCSPRVVKYTRADYQEMIEFFNEVDIG